MEMRRVVPAVGLLAIASLVGACGGNQPPKPYPKPASAATSGGSSTSVPRPPEPVPEPGGVPPEPKVEDPLKVSDIDKINQNSPFQPVFFALDSTEIDQAGQQALNANAGILKKYPEWVITIEGHADERGTAEYNLALGTRRAAAARDYLVALGIPGDRLRTVSYGKEFPFDPLHSEAAWSKNRRAHFVLTSR
ncbi:MAG TPA: peptidoglycan-associated lipoprotein Pal [Vicinamibacterales bacterium]|jgi:peptidoglycan-associated lipoprotein